MKVTTIGIDLAKDVFGLHGVDGEGRGTFKRRLVRSRLGVPEPAAAVFSGPGSLQQRTLLGARDRTSRSSSKTYESAVCKTL